MQTRSRAAAGTAGVLAALIVGLALLVLLDGPATGAPGAASATGAAGGPSQITTPITTARTGPSTTTARTVPRTTVTTRPSATTLPRTATTVARSGLTTLPFSILPAATTTALPTTTTTIAAINGHVPAAPATVPLETKASNGHVNLVFAWISVGGLAVGLAILAWRLFVTRPGGLDRSPYNERTPTEARR